MNFVSCIFGDSHYVSSNKISFSSFRVFKKSLLRAVTGFTARFLIRQSCLTILEVAIRYIVITIVGIISSRPGQGTLEDNLTGGEDFDKEVKGVACSN